MTLLLVSQRIHHIKVQCVSLPKHYTMKMYGGMEEAKLHTLIYTPSLDRGEWSVSCFGQGRVFWYYRLGGSISLVISLEVVAKRKITRSQTANNPTHSQLYYTAYIGFTQIFRKSNRHRKILSS